VIVDLLFPHLRPGSRVDGIDLRGEIAEVEQRSTRRLLRSADRNRRAHRRVRDERPVRAPGAGIERIHGAVFAAHEHPTRGHGWLPVGLRGVGERECPLQLQLRDVAAPETGVSGRLKPSVSLIDAPPVPERPAEWIANRRRRGRTLALRRHEEIGHRQRLAAHPFGHAMPILRAPAFGVDRHQPALVHDSVDRFG
jgi:hypothetical protein